MTFFALIATLFSFVLVVAGVFVHMYMYSNGALDADTSRRRRTRLSATSLSQTATISTVIGAENLYYGSVTARLSNTGISPRKRRLILYTLALLVTLTVLIVLVIGATQF